MKRTFQLFLLTLVVLTTGAKFANATHAASMELFYRWKADSTYEFTLIFYRNCQGSTAGPPASFVVTGSSISNILSTNFTATMLPVFGPGVPPLEPNNIYNCSNVTNFCLEEYTYRGDWTSPKKASDWVFSATLCCRPSSGILLSQNLSAGSFWVECGLNNLDFSDSSAQNWSPIFHNRRPNHPGHLNDTIYNTSFKTLCYGEFYPLDQSASEYQGDSMHYSFYNPQEINGMQMTFLNGFSLANPLPLIGGPLVINPITGVIAMTPGAPVASANYSVGIQVEEFRNDTSWNGSIMTVQPIRIGYVRRELLIHINDSTTCRLDSTHIKNRTIISMKTDSTVDVFFHDGIPGNPNSLVRCNTLSPDGSEFLVIDSSTYIPPNASTIRNIQVLSASWNCLMAGVTDRVTLKLAEPIACGNFSILLKQGTDLDVIQSECGYWELAGNSGELNTNNAVSAYIGPDTTVCYNSVFSIPLSTATGYERYLWSSMDSTNSIVISDTGKHWVTVTNNFLCTATDTMTVHTSSVPPVDLGPDTLVCPNAIFSKKLDAGPGYAGYLWNSTDTSRVINVNAPGTYWVEVSNNLQCTDVDSMEVLVSNIRPVNLGPDKTFCEGDTILVWLVAGLGYSDYTWSTGDTGVGINVTDTGNYWVSVSDTNQCEESDTMNIFTIDCDTIGNGIGNDITSKIHMYPNPSTGVIYIALPDSKGHEKLSLFDVNGRVVFQLILERSTNIVELNLHNVRRGIYFLKLTRNGESLLQEKLILSVKQ